MKALLDPIANKCITWITLLILVAWAASVALHWILIGERCGWTGNGCESFLLVDSITGYFLLVQHGPMLASTVGMLLLWGLHLSGENWRMRFAIAGVAQITVATGYVTAYHWDGLKGPAAPGEIIQNVGLAIAAVLTLIFVIWRERIAGNQVAISLSASYAERFQNGVQLLSGNSDIERFAGIHAIRVLAEDSISTRRGNSRYYEMCLHLLTRTQLYWQQHGISPGELSAIRRAIVDLQIHLTNNQIK